MLLKFNESEAKVWDVTAYLHLASGSLVSGSVLWLKPCFDFDSLFYLFIFLLHLSCCFAWYLASHTQLPIFPNTIIPSLPLPSHPQSLFHSHHRRPRLLSRQRSQIDEEHGRCSPHAKQTPPIWPPTWQRTGTGAQCRYTPLTWSTNSPHPISMESDLSHMFKSRVIHKISYFRLRCIITSKILSDWLEISWNSSFKKK